MTQRYLVHENHCDYKKLGYSRWGFKLIDTKTNKEQEIHFMWCGMDMNKSGTWDFAPLIEMYDHGDMSFDKFRLRLHQDDEYAEQQFVMNRRHDIWWKQHSTHSLEDDYSTPYFSRRNLSVRIRKTVHHVRFNNDLIKCTDIDGTKFYFSASLEDKKIMSTYPEWMLNKEVYNLLKLIESHLHVTLARKIAWFLRLNLSCEDIQMIKAHKKSEKLLKEWLTEDELRWLVYQDELKIKFEDEVFIVKKDPNARVDVVKDGKIIESLCVIPKDHGVAAGDALLGKIMMLKTNPVLFKKIAKRT